MFAHSVPPPITILVHGTLPTHITSLAALPAKVKAYQQFFYCQQGLHKATTLAPTYHLRKIADVLSQADPAIFPLERFYIQDFLKTLKVLI